MSRHIQAFEGLKTYPFTKDTFTVWDINGNEHIMSVNENFTNKYTGYENDYCGDDYACVKWTGGNDDDKFDCVQAIFPPPEFSGEVDFMSYCWKLEFDHPRVLASISCDLFDDRFNDGKEKANLTPLQEMMYRDILQIIREHLIDKDNIHEYLKEDEYNILKEIRRLSPDDEDNLLKNLKELCCSYLPEYRVVSQIAASVCKSWDNEDELLEKITEYIEEVMHDAIRSLCKDGCTWKWKLIECNDRKVLIRCD